MPLAAWPIAVFTATFFEWYRGRRALQNGTASVVEGRVENFVPMPFEGHAQEFFTVQGVSFSYSGLQDELGGPLLADRQSSR